MIGSGKQTAGGGERQADRWFVVEAVGRLLWVAVGRPLEKATYQRRLELPQIIKSY